MWSVPSLLSKEKQNLLPMHVAAQTMALKKSTPHSFTGFQTPTFGHVESLPANPIL
jgi:hypothetical protein